MTQRTIPTEFAPSARSSRADIRRQSDLFREPRLLEELTNAVADMLLILNSNRQIVHANRYVCDVFNVANEDIWLGLRPGEAMHCIHAFETEGGCGTTKFCRTCGSAKAILASQRGSVAVDECRITQDKQAGSLDLRVTAQPVRVEGDEFTVYSARDITDEKRREALERIFFHDVLNTAGGLKGYLEVLGESDEDMRWSFYRSAQELMGALIDEIIGQQELSAAERGDLTLQPARIRSNELLKSIARLYENHEVAQGREILIGEGSDDVELTSDRRLLGRVLGNMIKNALEATEPGSAVTIAATGNEATVTFSVHNESVIPEAIALQMFQRSFSTKGKGRGLGTYSIKLLGERYLGGAVTFNSTAEAGTVFSIEIPLKQQDRRV